MSKRRWADEDEWGDDDHFDRKKAQAQRRRKIDRKIKQAMKTRDIDSLMELDEDDY